MKKIIYIFFLLLIVAGSVVAQEEIKLYKHEPKESNEITVAESNQRADFVINISNPRMYFYPAKKEMNTGTAVLICPGGGYAGVSIIKEGSEIAKWFNELGVVTSPVGGCGGCRRCDRLSSALSGQRDFICAYGMEKLSQCVFTGGDQHLRHSDQLIFSPLDCRF